MVGRKLWIFWWRRWRCSRAYLLCLTVPCAALPALLFVEAIESWCISLVMDTAWVQPSVRSLNISPPNQEEYLLMPSPLVCQRANPYLLTMVITSPANQKARQAIRNTWGGETVVSGRRVITLFMVGVTSDPRLSNLLLEEARAHRDLVQGRFLESYANLSMKTLSMLGWTRRFCLETRFLAKVDDDVFFNPGVVIRYLSYRMEGDLYLGHVNLKVPPHRNSTSKHYVPADAYSLEFFPDYCSGTAYILSKSAFLKIAQATTAVSPHWTLLPEDVLVGLSARSAGIRPTHSPRFSGGPHLPYNRCCYQAMASVHHTSPTDMLRIWRDVHSPPYCSWMGIRASFGLCRIRQLLRTLLVTKMGLL